MAVETFFQRFPVRFKVIKLVCVVMFADFLAPEKKLEISLPYEFKHQVFLFFISCRVMGVFMLLDLCVCIFVVGPVLLRLYCCIYVFESEFSIYGVAS